MTAKPTPAPGRPPARSAPRAPVQSRFAPPANTGYSSVASRVPIARLAVPRTPLAVPSPVPPAPQAAPAASKPMFSRLATDASDDILDFDDDAAGRRLSPAVDTQAVTLGKRDKKSSPSNAVRPINSRPSKRLVRDCKHLPYLNITQTCDPNRGPLQPARTQTDKLKRPPITRCVSLSWQCRMSVRYLTLCSPLSRPRVRSLALGAVAAKHSKPLAAFAGLPLFYSWLVGRWLGRCCRLSWRVWTL